MGSSDRRRRLEEHSFQGVTLVSGGCIVLESHTCGWEKQCGLAGAAGRLQVAEGRCKFPTSACLVSLQRQIPRPRAPAEFGSETPCFRASWGLRVDSLKLEDWIDRRKGARPDPPSWSCVGGLGNGQTETLGPVALHCRIWPELKFVTLPWGLLL